MSALARLLQARGCHVSGCDRRTHLSFGERHPDAILVASSAIPPKEREGALHRSELLEELMEGYKQLVVTGTHGKTTTSALLAHVFQDASFAIGGLLLGTNARHGTDGYFVVEGDESDGSFLRTSPHAAIVTNVEEEHVPLDLLHRQLGEFFPRIEGPLFLCGDDPWLQEVPGIHYGFEPHNDLRASDYSASAFTIHWQGQTYRAQTPLLGRHNALNALAVFGLATEMGLEPQTVLNRLATFPGVSRRCEWLSDHVIDDYGHHPVEIAATLAGLRERFPDRPITAIVEPHRYTRSRDNDFSTCTALADRTFITDIYTAGESPIPGVTPETIIPTAETDLTKLTIHCHDLIVCFGAGDITNLAHELAARPVDTYTVGVICGGPSPEAHVSRISADTIANALTGYNVQRFELGDPLPDEIDIWIPIFHGPSGEDGLFAAYCEATRTPYVGSDFRSSALCMDKVLTKQALPGIPMAPFVDFWDWQWAEERNALLTQIADLSYPLYVKAAHLGSGIGVHQVQTPDQLIPAIEATLEVDNRLLVEQGIPGRELEIGVMEDLISPPGEVLKGDQFFSSEVRYGPNSMPRDPNPDVPNVDDLQSLARRIYRLLGCSQMVRLDFFLTPDGDFIFNEANPIPGFTPISMIIKLWERVGYPLPALLDKLICRALRRG